MTSYYNEIDPYAAQWLRNLIEAKLIAPGHVDSRSIVDVRPADLAGFTQCHFFAGLGGWAGALRLADFPDERPVWTGSCPCQPFSLAGKQKGFDDDRHLWPIWRGLVAERRPAKIYGEQVASASQWLGLVRGDMEALDYAVGAIPCEAASAGADHLRDRFWFVANAQEQRRSDRHGGPIQGPTVGEWTSEQFERRRGDGLDLGDTEHGRREGRQQERSRTGPALPSGEAGLLANADSGAIWHEPGRSCRKNRPGPGEHCDDREVDVADSSGEPWRLSEHAGWANSTETVGSSEGFEWVVGADGKARRVKSGIRLLAHGIPARVAKLRALGNAIDLRPAATFIKATM